eukprot:Plantae.Rhodophyta-Palmaria_palmata.ctg27694.p1 GENE.Plantae.Rhodophyta-Palmaria_palmata.ctg27694~~Plantae.Rhodophyta-Palmaria_palmata.ctg27694.p1  ORF type:complete len:136 (-),score=5.33 Plantae.Rhodophyta-Palmaria_palmata.ctg27694:48-455(-)
MGRWLFEVLFHSAHGQSAVSKVIFRVPGASLSRCTLSGVSVRFDFYLDKLCKLETERCDYSSFYLALAPWMGSLARLIRSCEVFVQDLGPLVLLAPFVLGVCLSCCCVVRLINSCVFPSGSIFERSSFGIQGFCL